MACSAINGATHTTLQGQNRLILAKLLGLLLPRGVEEESGLVEAAASTLSEADKRAAYQAAEKIAAIIRSTPSLSSVENLIHEFDVAGWVVTAENMQDNFREVERTVFCDGVNWGRIIAFLAFSVSFSAYVSSKGIKGGVQSVFGWTSRVLDRILSDFMSKKNGWTNFALLYKVKCPYSIYGCPFEDHRQFMGEHLRQDTVHHAQIQADSFSQLMDRVRALELSSQLDSLEEISEPLVTNMTTEPVQETGSLTSRVNCLFERAQNQQEMSIAHCSMSGD